jgi:hypothetical protein
MDEETVTTRPIDSSQHIIIDALSTLPEQELLSGNITAPDLAQTRVERC